MNQAAATTHSGYKAQQPKDYQNYKYCPQHDSHPFQVAPLTRRNKRPRSTLFTLPDEREHPLLWNGPRRRDVRAASKQ